MLLYSALLYTYVECGSIPYVRTAMGNEHNAQPKKVQTLSPGDTEMLEHVLLHVRVKLNVCILTLPHVYIFTILSNLTV